MIEVIALKEHFQTFKLSFKDQYLEKAEIAR